MDSIQLMIEEHKYIKRMLLVIRKACYGILKGNEIDYNDFNKMIEFVRKYADAHHHGKEEKMLFNRMVDEIGTTAEKLVNHGMLVEHDLGRLYMQELEVALEEVKSGNEEAKIDVIACAVSYTHLLNRHIDKEDNTVYTFAKRTLKQETLNKINNECERFEAEMESNNVQNKYINILKELEEKYGI